ncbi:MAG: hypothetical protein LBS65_06040 [Desulfovibrio sp.]|nr:hypothetical protein [Desulfovibrio sp.]
MTSDNDGNKYVAYGICRDFPRPAMMAVMACALALLCAACGKTGYPRPMDEGQTFSWMESHAVPAGECIAFSGKFTGAYQNFDGLRLELDGLRRLDECQGCPFVADEIAEFSPSGAGFNPMTGDLGFSYCPRSAQAYRWRMIAANVFGSLPHASMSDRLLLMDEEP